MENLGLNLPLLIAQIINFVILLVLLYFVAYKPILKMLDQRSAKIKESMDEAEAIRQQTANTEEKIRNQLSDARMEGEKILTQAGQLGEKLKEEARQEAHREAETLITRAKSEISRESDKVIDELRQEFIEVAIAAAEKVVKETLDKDKHRQIIERVIEESSAFSAKPDIDKKS